MQSLFNGLMISRILRACWRPPLEGGVEAVTTHRLCGKAKGQLLDALESRTMLSAVYWDGAADSAWANVANWSVGSHGSGVHALPGAGDDAVIDTGGTVPITFATEASVGSVTTNRPISVEGGTLTVSGQMRLNRANLTLAGGTVRSATVNATSASVMITSSPYNTLDGVTVNSPVVMTGSYSYLNIVNGLTLNGMLSLGYAARVYFNGGSQTLGGTGTVLFTNNRLQGLIANADGMTLTIGAGMTIRGGNDSNSTYDGSVIGFSDSSGGRGDTSIVNLGTIRADGGSSLFIVVNPQGTGTFRNQGTIVAAGGGGLTLNGVAGNLNTVSLSASGSSVTLNGTDYINNAGINLPTGTKLKLGGTFTTAGAGTLTSSGGRVYLTGTLVNTGTTLTLNASTGSWLMAGGTIRGGAINTLDGSQLVIGGLGATLDAVTLNSSVNLVVQSLTLTVLNGLELNGTLTMAYSGRVYFDGGSQTLSGTGAVIFASTSSQGIIAKADWMTLTIGSGMTIRGGSTYGAIIGYDNLAGGGSNTSIINLGTITADGGQGTRLIVSPPPWGTFSNRGTLNALDGAELMLNRVTGDLTGFECSGAGSSLRFNGENCTLPGPITVPSGTYLSLGGAFSYAAATINVESGARFSLSGYWNNASTINVQPGAALFLDGMWSNSATINVEEDSSISLGGTWRNTGSINIINATTYLGNTFTGAALDSLHRVGGRVNITGTLLNFGATLTLNAASGSWHLLGGTIRGGVINEEDGYGLVIESTQGGTLDEVTLNGSLDMTEYNSFLHVQNGLTLNGTLLLNYGGRVYFDGDSQTLDGTGTIVFTSSSAQGLIVRANWATLTIGAGITIRGGGAITDSSVSPVIGYSSYWGGGIFTSIINYGTILVEGGGAAKLIISSSSFTNHGTLKIVPGGVLTVNARFTQSRTGSLTIQVDGNGAYGSLVAIGETTLAGRFTMAALGGFDPSLGLPLFSANVVFGSSLTGHFDSFDLPTTHAGSYHPSVQSSGQVSIVFNFADFNGDGGIDGSDIEPFLLAWETGQPWADINGDGGVDGSDIAAFFALWASGGR
jgi:hypothetical protein